jgi:transcriptional regulator with XRE-family HTH domain
MTYDLTTDEWERELGQQVRDLRLRLNLAQDELAERAGIALGVIKRLESGRGSTLASLVKVLRVLGRVDWLSTLAPAVSISPLQMVKDGASRQRASHPKGLRRSA